MRTTVTLDPDVQALLKKAMRQHDSSFKHTLNDAIRKGLGAGLTRAAGPDAFDFPAFHMGEPLVDLGKATALAAELEDQALVARMRRGA